MRRGLLLGAIKSYTTNHAGLYPESFEQMVTSGDLGTTNFAGNLGLGDFKLVNDGEVSPQGDKILVEIRVPIKRPGMQSVMVEGAISDDGVIHTETWNVSE